MSATIQKKTYTVVITKDEIDGGFVGHCKELNAFSQGETYSEIMGNISEAVELAAQTMEDVNDFNMLIVKPYND